MVLKTICRVNAVAAVAVLLLFASPAFADEVYPSRPVRVLAASAAGGNPDVVARLLSAKLSEMFNNPFIVEDVPGVGGVIAAKQTREAPAGRIHAQPQRFRRAGHQHRDESGCQLQTVRFHTDHGAWQRCPPCWWSEPYGARPMILPEFVALADRSPAR